VTAEGEPPSPAGLTGLAGDKAMVETTTGLDNGHSTRTSTP
jgi:hypothetical protein